MTYLRLFIGDSEYDEAIKLLLERWISKQTDVQLEYHSIHVNPALIVRLGITELPALVLQEEIIAQGTPENWILPLLDHLLRYYLQDKRHSSKKETDRS
ncbi:MAG: hypothetical protein ACFE0Q_21400 [Anaerolineae bacterium]